MLLFWIEVSFANETLTEQHLLKNWREFIKQVMKDTKEHKIIIWWNEIIF